MVEKLTVEPEDAYNQAFLAQVHPPNWVNPEAAKSYNLVVIGGGTAGLVTAAGAAGLGAKVALVESHFMGGDCLNVGCVPSKALLRCSRAWADVRDAGNFGIEVPPGVLVNFPAVMERMRNLRANLSPNDSVSRFQGLGIDVFLGRARFSGKDTISVGDEILFFRKAVIATGTKPLKSTIPGIEKAGVLTNETVFSLTELPRRLAVIGAGPIGCELAQAFARLGASVTLLGNHDQILPREDPEASGLVEKAMTEDGLILMLNCQVTRVDVQGEDKVLQVDCQGKKGEVRVDKVLMGIGRQPNVQDMGLDVAGVDFNTTVGVKVNDHLQTSNRRIYAAGDICSPYKFTHAAEAMARIVIQNALFRRKAKASALTIPWCTYTDPEIAHVGLNEQQADEAGIEIKSFKQSFSHVDRAVLDGETDGFVKVHVRKGTDTIVGATLVARHAGEMISEITLAIVGQLGLKTLAQVIHPYPTQAEAIKKIADAYNRSRLTPRLKSWLRVWFAWTR